MASAKRDGLRQMRARGWCSNSRRFLCTESYGDEYGFSHRRSAEFDAWLLHSLGRRGKGRRRALRRAHLVLPTMA